MRHSGTQAHISAWCSCESVCVRAFVRKRMCASCVLSVLFGGGTHRISHILCYVFLKRACVYYMLSRCFARFHGYFFGHDTISRSLSPAVRRLVFISLPLSLARSWHSRLRYLFLLIHLLDKKYSNAIIH